MPCRNLAAGVIVCMPSGETKPAPKRRKKRWWCFECRRHLLHTLMMFDPGPESYYGPHFWWQCPRCGEEHVLFPGREWVYPDEA